MNDSSGHEGIGTGSTRVLRSDSNARLFLTIFCPKGECDGKARISVEGHNLPINWFCAISIADGEVANCLKKRGIILALAWIIKNCNEWPIIIR